MMLLLVTLGRLCGGCYLFEVDTPLGNTKPDKRLLYCKRSSDLRRLSFSPFQTGLFCTGLKLRPLRPWGWGGV